jgi:aryl-alcohol dehydrogenase-like predicted oxidoreductase
MSPQGRRAGRRTIQESSMMEYRRLGASGLKVPVLSLGGATFGGGNEIFRAWGTTDAAGARRLVDVCLEAGLTMFDTANSYSNGLSEEILGAALEGRRDAVLVATKATTPIGAGPNDGGSTRQHVTRAVEDSLRRLRTDHLDLLYLHEFDATTPVEEAVRVLDDLVTAGKVRYVAASNFSGWQLMKSLAVADRYGWVRYAAHQVSYSLATRDYEHEQAPLGADQGVGAVVWSGLAGGALSGKVRRGQPLPGDSRLTKGPEFTGLTAGLEHVCAIVDVLDAVAAETGRTVSQIALNWLLAQPTVSSIVLGARHEDQLHENLGAIGWSLSAEQLSRLDAVSAHPVPYPYDHQAIYPDFQPSPWTH